ncbi:P-loop NTPase family protein [Lactococcus kimchii]|uniref:adenylate kinase n=1 Tax=Lactococcus sp. S-13 TaxID=2507158 RepID=UPI001022AC53|nr:adenylate kinase [Lactococcus sp. S-13]RZI48644.1 adenylate kinase [Lactococcus sp. S-13]
MKIVIIGCSGTGKSTLARDLATLTDFPILHLDKVFHKYPSEIAREKLRQATQNFISENENGIIDGNYGSTFDERLPFADEIVWLQLPPVVSLFRVIKRSIGVRLAGKIRPDMAEEFVEKWDKDYLEFLKFVWTFSQKEVPEIERKLTEFDVWDKLVILKNRKDKEKYLAKYDRKAKN